MKALFQTLDNVLQGCLVAALCIGGFFYIYPEQPQKPFKIEMFDPGGEVGTYIRFFERVRDSGLDVIVDGECVSACTLLMGIIPKERICLTSRSSFGFHQAADGETGQAVPDITKRLNRYFYPKVVKDWIANWEKEHGPLTLDVVYMLPDDFKGYYKMCNPEVAVNG